MEEDIANIWQVNKTKYEACTIPQCFIMVWLNWTEYNRWTDIDYCGIKLRVWRTGTENSRYREFLIFLVVWEQIGTGKKSRNRYRK